MHFSWRPAIKTLYKISVTKHSESAVQRELANSLRAIKKASKKTWERDLSYQPQRLSPLDYIVFKILHQQFGEDSPSLFPIAIGIARKTLNQAKRILSHGSL